MKKFIVYYEYQMPGWDEFDKVSDSEFIVKAKTPREAEEKFWEARKMNTERNPMKFATGVIEVKEWEVVISEENF